MKSLLAVALLVVIAGGVAPDGIAGSTAKVLVFERQGGWIWRARVDGSHQVRVTRGDAPRLSPDGRLLAFLRPAGAASGNDRELWVMHVSGGAATMLRSSPTGFGVPVWSPDSRTIAVADAASLVVIDAITGELRDSLPARDGFSSFVFSPTGDRLAFVWVALGGSGVSVLRLSDGRVVPVSSRGFGFGVGGYVAWGPGDALAFACDEGNVCVAAADGSTHVEYQLASSLRRLGAMPRAWTRDRALVLEVPPTHNGRLIRFDPLTNRARYLTRWIPGLDALAIASGGQWLLATTGRGEFGFCSAGVIERISVDTGRRSVLVKHACDGSWNA